MGQAKDHHKAKQTTAAQPSGGGQAEDLAQAFTPEEEKWMLQK